MADIALPHPLVPAEVVLRDMAVEQFGIDIGTARRFVNEAADRMESPTRQRPNRHAKSRGHL